MTSTDTEKAVVNAIDQSQFERASEIASRLHKGSMLHSLANGLRALYVDKDSQKSCSLLRKAFAASGRDIFVGVKLAEAMELDNNSKKAITLLSELSKRNPNEPQLIIRQAFLLAKTGDTKSATELLETGTHCDKPEVMKALGVIHFSATNYVVAESVFRKLTLVAPKDPEAFYNLGVSLLKQRLHEKAEHALKEALCKGFKDLGNLYSDLGLAIEAQNRPGEAETFFRKAIELKGPGALPDATYHLALIMLRTGRLREGFNIYDARFKRTGQKLDKNITSIPWWKQEHREGKLLIWSEQGLGDQILHSRYFPWVSRNFDGVITAVVDKRLINLFTDLYPGISFQPRLDVTPEDYDYQIASGSIGRLIIEKDHAPSWLEHKDSDPRRLIRSNSNDVMRVGISWFSNNDDLSGKNMNPAIYSTFLNYLPERSTLVNLQYDASEDDLREIESVCSKHIDRKDADNRNGIDELVEVVTHLDLVITISNTTAHIAGILGTPCILLSPKYDGRLYYWELTDNNSRSRWYPSITIVPQQVDRDWLSAVDKYKEVLNEFTQDHQ